jgi:hypothetical protein
MKNLTKLLVIIWLIAIIGCTATDGNIVGTWKCEQDKSEGSVSMWSIIKIQINGDGRYNRTTKLYISGEIQEIKENGLWERDSDGISFTETSTESGSPNVTYYIIKELSEQTLILSASENGKEYKWKYERIK